MPRRDEIDRSDRMVTCPECSGTGQVPAPHQPSVRIVCPVCDGTGRCTRAQADRSRTRARQRREATVRRRRLRREQRAAHLQETGNPDDPQLTVGPDNDEDEPDNEYEPTSTTEPDINGTV